MPLPRPHIPNQSSFRFAPSDALLADKAITHLKRHPHNLHSFSSHFTPDAASCLLLKSQFDQTLTLKFLNWANRHSFFTFKPKCLALHILTRFKLYKSAQSLVEDVAEDDRGNLVFDYLSESMQVCNSSSAVFDLVVKSYSHLNLVDKAMNIVSLAKAHGLVPGVLSYNAILDAVITSRGSVEFAEEVLSDMVRSGVSPNVYTFNILIRGFSAVGNLELALCFWSEMERNGCLLNVVTYNTLIDAYCKLRRIDDAFGLLRSMGVKSLEPNLISYNVVINGLCREGRMEETSGIVEEMKGKGFVPDEVTYNTLISGYCKEGNFHQALVLQEEMRRNGLSPNVVTYTALISAICKSKNMNRVMEFFEQMCVRGLRPNERTYTTLIDGFSQQGFLYEAYGLLNEMIRVGFAPSIVTYNALINGYCLLGRMEEAMGIVQDMVGKGLSPDVVSYSTIITGLCRHQNLESAFQVKVEMLEKGISPDVVTYSSLIQGICQQRRLVDACNLFREMISMGLRPDEFTYTTLINAYCKEGDLSKALQLNDEMTNKGFLPDVVNYSVLINGLNKQARMREAKKLLFKLFYEKSVPDDLTYNTLIESCTNVEFKSVVGLVKGFCIKGLMKEADQVFETVIKRKYKPNGAVYDVIIHGHCREGNVQKALDLYKEMLLSGFLPHTVTVIALIKELFTMGMNNELSQVIENTLRSCELTDAELAKLLVETNHKEGNMDAVFNVLGEMAKDGLLPNSGASACAGGVNSCKFILLYKREKFISSFTTAFPFTRWKGPDECK